MSNHNTGEIDLDLIPRDVAARIQSSLTEQNHPVKWLADTTAIPNVTLQRKLRAPGEFTLRQLISISFALNVTFDWLAFGACPTCGSK